MKHISITLVALVLVALTGCLVTGSSKQVRSGNYVSDDAFKRIEPGKTTAGWVLATLGEPTSRQTIEDGSEVWKWTYSEHRQSSGAVFLIFGGSDEKEITGNAFVELRDGIVTNAWRS